MTILLLGLLGSGKSTIGTLLADDLHATFVEMDYGISMALGGARPQDVSEAEWKECQTEVAKDLSVQRHLVIATSGNIVENDLNILYFKEHTEDLHIIYLDASIETLLNRAVGNDQGKAKSFHAHLLELHRRRDALNRSFSDLIIRTDHKTPRQVVDDILSVLHS